MMFHQIQGRKFVSWRLKQGLIIAFQFGNHGGDAKEEGISELYGFALENEDFVGFGLEIYSSGVVKFIFHLGIH